MMGNYHVRFLGGSGLVTAPGYPVKMWENIKSSEGKDMKKIFFVLTILILIVPALSNGEMLKCEGYIVNSTNDFDKRITYYIDIVIPADNAEEYVIALADKDSGKFKSLLQHNPILRKTCNSSAPFSKKAVFS